MKKTLETSETSGCVRMTSRLGRIVCAVVCVAPDTIPSAIPSATIRVPT
jgi:hypothetical protein